MSGLTECKARSDFNFCEFVVISMIVLSPLHEEILQLQRPRILIAILRYYNIMVLQAWGVPCWVQTIEEEEVHC